MTLFQSLITFAVFWWLMLFILLPVGVRAPEKIQPGHAAGAPDKPYLAAKMLGATVIAFLLTWLMRYLLNAGILNLRDTV